MDLSAQHGHNNIPFHPWWPAGQPGGENLASNYQLNQSHLNQSQINPNLQSHLNQSYPNQQNQPLYPLPQSLHANLPPNFNNNASPLHQHPPGVPPASSVIFMQDKASYNEAEVLKKKAWVCYLPVFGRLQILKDVQGLICSFIILFYWVFGNWSTWLVILLPHYNEGHISGAMLVVYTIVSALCITSFLRATTLSPGKLDANLSPKDDWTLCQRCFKHRPPQTHHCRRCGHCVRKMDHHCPWINNCVGEDNQYAFMLLVLYAYTLSLVTLVLDILHVYYLPECLNTDQSRFTYIHQTGIIRLAIVMAVFMTCGGASLYFSQHMSIIFNTPSIEFMKIQQRIFQTGINDFQWPKQNHSWLHVYRKVCGDLPFLLWLLPCIRRRHSYEQLAQEKLI